jgi:hypothetical protein
MAIKINGNTVIDDSQNFTSTGNITMGNGNVVLSTTLDELQVNFNTVLTANATGGMSSAVGNIAVNGNIEASNLISAGGIYASGNVFALNLLSAGNVGLEGADMVTANVNLNIGTQQAGGNIRIGNVLPSSIELGGNTTGATIKLGSTTSTVNIPGNVTSTGNISTGVNNSVRIGNLTITDESISSTDHQITIGSTSDLGNVIIVGNLQVNGTTTTINSNNVTTNDLVISVANNAISGAAADNGGFEVGPIGSPFITWLYSNAGNAWVSSGSISTAGNVIATGNISGSRILGNAQQLGNVGQSFAVTNVDAANYIFNGVANDPTVSLTRGQTYYFNMNCGNTHPLWIKTAPTLGTGNAYTSGVTNNGVFSGTITFQVPWDAPNILYYQCQIHAGMGGILQVVDGTMLQNGNSTVTVYSNADVATTVAGTSNVFVVSSTGTTTTGTVSVTGSVTAGGNLSLVGNIVDTGPLTIITSSNGNISLAPNGTGNVNIGGNVMPTANATANIGSASLSFNTVFAKATSAQYADLAEKYTADAEYAPGTVVVFGGTAEVTVDAEDGDTKVAGVVSTNPSYIMNSGLESEHVATVALTGRVPTMVVGSVKKGDLMVAAGLGRARAEADPRVGSVIGKALEDSEGDATIEVVVGRF